jgi:hypothetical protein
MINHWYAIVSDQMRILLTSGLYDACEEISIGCLGRPEERASLEKYFIDIYPKLKLRYSSAIPSEYEFPTLKLIEKDDSDYAGFYFHAKGVTKPLATEVGHWTAFLNEEMLNQWQRHYENISENGFDVSSVNYLKSPDHFSGNFWWFNRKHINNLPPIDALDHGNRWHAEQWIVMGNGKFYYPEFREPGETPFTMKYK